MKRLVTLAAAALAPALLAAQAPKPATPVSTGPLPHKHAPQPTTANITASDLMTRLYIFADDSMLGREAGTAGNVKGTDYIAAEARRIGLEPAGESGGFFQTVPMIIRAADSSSTLEVAGSRLALGRDFLPFPLFPSFLP